MTASPQRPLLLFNDEDDRNSSADSSVFFSPPVPSSASVFLFRSTKSSSLSSNNVNNNINYVQPQGSGEKLPPLHDSSWIGARLSPIGGQSFDHDDDDDVSESSALLENQNDIEEEKPTSATDALLFRRINNIAASSSSSSSSPSPSLLSAPYFHKNHHSKALLFEDDNNSRVFTEKSRLLRHSRNLIHYKNTSTSRRTTTTQRKSSVNNSTLHYPLRNHHRVGIPLPAEEDDEAAENDIPLQHLNQMNKNNNNDNRSRGMLSLNWGTLICATSGLGFVAMSTSEHYGYYYSDWYGDAVTTTSTASATTDATESSTPFLFESRWATPWIRPSGATLYRFGAFVPVLSRDYSWRLVTSAFLCSSVVEWIVVVGAWQLISRIRILYSNPQSPYHHQNHQHQQPWYQWCGIYLVACFTGQMWMTAWDPTTLDHHHAVTGCVAWSTCGVLTHVGVLTLSRRMILYLTAAVLMLFSLLQQPYSSVVGTVGASSIGWALAAAEVITLPSSDNNNNNNNVVLSSFKVADSYRQRRPSWVCWMGRMLALKIVIIPTLYIAFAF